MNAWNTAAVQKMIFRTASFIDKMWQSVRSAKKLLISHNTFAKIAHQFQVVWLWLSMSIGIATLFCFKRMSPLQPHLLRRKEVPSTFAPTLINSVIGRTTSPNGALIMGSIFTWRGCGEWSVSLPVGHKIRGKTETKTALRCDRISNKLAKALCRCRSLPPANTEQR